MIYITLIIHLFILLHLPITFSSISNPNLQSDDRYQSNKNSYCGRFGYRNATDGDCVCDRQHYGDKCQFLYCPFGKSWLSIPITNYKRFSPNVPCSNMGICDPYSGKCSCRDGYEGRACERLACPRSGYSNNLQVLSSAISLSTPGTNFVNKFLTSNASLIPACSGHGLCMTLREAGRKFNGRTLIYPPVNYDVWDADRIQGCVCDLGWQGYDCSLRSCPYGIDPQNPIIPLAPGLDSFFNTNEPQVETIFLQCQADSGFFTLKAFGYYTMPIPYYSTVGYLAYVLKSLPLSLNASITIEVLGTTGSGIFSTNPIASTPICHRDHLTTTKIQLLNYLTSYLPPFYITKNVTSYSRQFPSATSEPLSLSTGESTLRFQTRFRLSCPICVGVCSGNIVLKYKNSLSNPIDVTSGGSISLLISEISSLSDLINEGWANFHVLVNISSYPTSYLSGTTSYWLENICSTTYEVIHDISIYSDYGNIPNIYLIPYVVSSSDIVNITLTNYKGNGNYVECSNQGFCDYSTGTCKCLSFFNSNSGLKSFYAVGSSSSGDDINSSPGNRGDCGHIVKTSTAKGCYINGVNICYNRGLCNNNTNVCECYNGYTGMTCQIKNCPYGPALFDEPTTSTSAHSYKECSNNGFCDRSVGRCVCRNGFVGQACEIKDCPRNTNTGSPCSGNGWCLSISKFYSLYGYIYGNKTTYPNNYLSNRFSNYPTSFPTIFPTNSPTNNLSLHLSNWDAFIWNECVCSAKTSSGFIGNTKLPMIGPKANVSGYEATGRSLPGYSGYDCSLMNCPKGDNVRQRNNYGGKYEIQLVRCIANYNSNEYFTLTFINETSERIYSYYNLSRIQLAIESMKNVDSVTVYFANTSIYSFTACSSSFTYSTGGFYVQFNTELGDLPLMTSSNSSVIVTEYSKGTKSNLECGGPTVGMCDRKLGVCVCSDYHGSSNSSNAPGNLGDCGYQMLNPIHRSQEVNAFGESS